MQQINSEIAPGAAFVASSSSSSASSAPQRKLTYEEFLREYDGRRAEYVDGEVILPMSVTQTHDNLTGFLSAVLRFFVEAKKLGRICNAPYQMKMNLNGETRGREPDIFFVKTENLNRVKEQFFDGAADLVIEVVSPESVARDTQDKFEEYEAAGVAEYWLIDANRRTANFYGFDAHGRYQLLPIEGGKFTSRAINGFWLATDWLWRETLPDLTTVLKELRAI